jgi:hypothetical protein
MPLPPCKGTLAGRDREVARNVTYGGRSAMRLYRYIQIALLAALSYLLPFDGTGIRLLFRAMTRYWFFVAPCIFWSKMGVRLSPASLLMVKQEMNRLQSLEKGTTSG